MSAPKNIQRDGTWITPDTSENKDFATANNVTSATTLYNSDAVVHVDAASAQADPTTLYTLGAGDAAIIGINMTPPIGDNVPYRIKASINSVIPSDNDQAAAIVIGYAPSTITGSDDQIDQVAWIPFKAEDGFDDLIIVPNLAAADANYGNALVIGLAIICQIAIVTKPVLGHISVQSLAVKPPTMQNSIS